MIFIVNCTIQPRRCST